MGSEHGLRTPRESFFLNPKHFGLGQTFWGDIFCGIWGIFGQTISTHLGTETLVHVFHYSTIISTKNKPLYQTLLYIHMAAEN